MNYWPIWGNTNDLVGGLHLKNGTNVSLTIDRFGYANSALFFNDGFYDLPDGVYFNSSFTLSAWIKVYETRYMCRLLEVCITSACQGRVVFGLSLNLNGTLFFKITNATDSLPTLESSVSLPVKVWQFITFTLNNTLATIYLNGSIVAQGPSYVPRNVVRASNYLGRSHWLDPDRDLYADLDELRIYNRALSQVEIIGLMNDNFSYIKALN